MSLSKLIMRSAALCAFAAAGAAHAQSANVNVTGVIVPPACSAQFAGGADLDWGEVSHNILSTTAYTTLDPKAATLQVSCDDGLTTHIAFWATDPNASSAMVGTTIPGTSQANAGDPNRIFGLGMDPVTNQKIGNFSLVSTGSSFDGTQNTSTFGYVGDATHTSTSFSSWSIGEGYSTKEDWTVLDPSTSAPAVANTFMFSFNVYPQLNTSNNITNAQQVPFSGTAQFYVRYF